MRNRSLMASMTIAGIAVTAIAASNGASAAPSAKRYTLAQVRTHARTTDCWAAINGGVYNLTKWIPRHPGGAPVIRGLCGKDATTAFRSMHGSAPRPAAMLATFRVGSLVKVAKPRASATAAPKPSPSASAVLSAAMVATHRSATSCWSIVDGTVYDLTSWIAKHPGGSSAIQSMCGIDASAAFHGKHGTASTPTRTLAGYRIGTLGSAATPAPTTNAVDAVYTAAQVKAHGTATNCWVVISGSVYEMTDWIPRHPGGQSVIKAACGLDASSVFSRVSEHGRTQNQQMLATFRIGAFDTTSGTLPTAIRTDDD